MESKVKEYQELYGEFEVLYEQVSKAEVPIRDIEEEIRQHRSKQSNVDYNNPEVVVGYMETYIDESIANNSELIKNEVNVKMSELTNPSGNVKKNFDKAVKWLSFKKVDKYLRSADIDMEEEIWVGKAEKATGFNALTILNTIFSFVFRFEFLRFLPKAVRIIASVIFWSIFLIPKLLERVYNKYQVIYDNEIADLSNQEYDLVHDQFTKDFLGECILTVVAVAALIVVINIIVYFMAKYFAKKYLADNKAVCLCFIDPNGFKNKMYDHRMNEYMKNTVAAWKNEIEMIRNNVVSYNLGSDSLIVFVRNDLYYRYNDLEEKINVCKSRIEEIQVQNQEMYLQLQEIIPKLKNKEAEVDILVSDSSHNNAVLSPYVSAGYSQHCTEGVKELVFFKHNYKPMLICYSDDTAKDGERFRKNVARLIELFMQGFFQENYYEYINMWLVDYEGLYFPESRTKGLMKVIHTQQGVQQMFDELKVTRDTVDSLEDGRIRNINPTKLANRENPIKYNIVYFVGYDFTAVEREITQLFIGGENFGFLPIIFMKKTMAQSLLQDDGSAKVFARVVEKMRDNNQIYEFEGLVSEFEYDLMVSNQKRLLDEKLCVNKIISMNEFIDAAESDEGMDIDKVLYLDTYQLDKVVYDAISDLDYIKLFTINGEIPDFVTKEVINL